MRSAPTIGGERISLYLFIKLQWFRIANKKVMITRKSRDSINLAVPHQARLKDEIALNNRCQ